MESTVTGQALLERQLDTRAEQWPSFSHELGWPERPSRSLGRKERQTILALGDAAIWAGVIGALSAVGWGHINLAAGAIVSTIVWLVVGYFGRIYRLGTASRIRSSFEALVKTSVAVDAILLLTSYLQPRLMGRFAFMVLAVAGPMAIGIWRYLSGRFIAGSKFERRAVIVGGGARCLSLLEAIDATAGHGVRVVGVVDDGAWERVARVASVPVVGHVPAVWDVVHDLAAEEVILALEERPDPRLAHELAKCYEHGIAVTLMPHVYGEVSGQVPVEHMATDWLGAVPLNRPGGWLYDALKRIIDTSLSALALVILAPLLAMVSLVIRIWTPGPILFRQERLGLHGRVFTLFKFRSMDAGAHTVTSVGRILRRTHLDEIPQLLNVLRGDMSLVGPRPKRADEGRDLAERIPLYRARQSVRPGLTGWAQIVYRYAHTSHDEMIKLRYDLYYIQNKTLLLDFIILVRTASRLLGG